MYVCAFVSVALTLLLFFLHNTIQVHRSLSANTCREEPTGEKTETHMCKLYKTVWNDLNNLRLLFLTTRHILVCVGGSVGDVGSLCVEVYVSHLCAELRWSCDWCSGSCSREPATSSPCSHKTFCKNSTHSHWQKRQRTAHLSQRT